MEEFYVSWNWICSQTCTFTFDGKVLSFEVKDKEGVWKWSSADGSDGERLLISLRWFFFLCSVEEPAEMRPSTCSLLDIINTVFGLPLPAGMKLRLFDGNDVEFRYIEPKTMGEIIRRWERFYCRDSKTCTGICCDPGPVHLIIEMMVPQIKAMEPQGGFSCYKWSCSG